MIIFMIEINKKEQKKRLNARMKRLICPKSPLMVFSELYKDVPIQLENTTRNNNLYYTASFIVRLVLNYYSLYKL